MSEGTCWPVWALMLWAPVIATFTVADDAAVFLKNFSGRAASPKRGTLGAAVLVVAGFFFFAMLAS